jgi:hypothetical protein
MINKGLNLLTHYKPNTKHTDENNDVYDIIKVKKSVVIMTKDGVEYRLRSINGRVYKTTDMNKYQVGYNLYIKNRVKDHKKEIVSNESKGCELILFMHEKNFIPIIKEMLNKIPEYSENLTKETAFRYSTERMYLLETLKEIENNYL